METEYLCIASECLCDKYQSNKLLCSMWALRSWCPPDSKPAPHVDQERDPLLTERQRTHGNFSHNAYVSQALKTLIHGDLGWHSLGNPQREALDMICSKISRILSGQSQFKDHWDDIAGYAKLASEACDD